MSLLNTATDVYTISIFFRQGKIGYANATIGMLLSVAFMQLLIVWAQNKKKKGVTMLLLKESLIVISGFKPVAIALRVILGAKATEDDVFDPEIELIMTKLVEV